MQDQQQTELLGTFWLPNKKKNKVSGQLSFGVGKSITLQILGTLGIDEDESPIIILCEYPYLATKRRLTLLFNKCIMKEKNEEFYRCTYLLKDIYLRSKNPIKFKKLIVNFSNMELLHNYKNEFYSLTRQQENNICTISYKDEKEILLFRNDEKKIELVRMKDPVFDTPSNSEITIKNTDYINVIYKNPVLFSVIHQDLIMLRQMVSFMENHKVNINKAYIRPPVKYMKHIKINLAQLHTSLGQQNDLSEFSVYDALIKTDYLQNLGKICKYWSKLPKEFYPIFNIYYSLLPPNNLSLETYFLNVVQALESYFRRRPSRKKEFDKDVYEAFLVRLFDTHCFAKEKWTDDEISTINSFKIHGNEISFKNKVKECIDICSDILILKNVDALLKITTSLRHYYTHYDKKYEKIESEIPNKDILDYADILLIVLTILLLKEMSLSSSTIRGILRDNRKIKHVLHSYGVIAPH